MTCSNPCSNRRGLLLALLVGLLTLACADGTAARPFPAPTLPATPTDVRAPATLAGRATPTVVSPSPTPAPATSTATTIPAPSPLPATAIPAPSPVPSATVLAALPSATTTPEALSQQYEITERDAGRTFVYAETSRFAIILDGRVYPRPSVKLRCDRPDVLGPISNLPSVAPPLYAVRYEGVTPGTCTISNQGFAVTVRIVPLPPAATSAATTTVRVYLISLGNGTVGAGTVGCGDTLVAVERRVPATRAPLTAAIRELLATKGQAVSQLGLYSALAHAELTIDRIVMEGGTARIQLVGQLRLGGECDNPRVKAQLEQTARQFPTVKDTAITINGVALDQALSLR